MIFFMFEKLTLDSKFSLKMRAEFIGQSYFEFFQCDSDFQAWITIITNKTSQLKKQTVTVSFFKNYFEKAVKMLRNKSNCKFQNFFSDKTLQKPHSTQLTSSKPPQHPSKPVSITFSTHRILSNPKPQFDIQKLMHNFIFKCHIMSFLYWQTSRAIHACGLSSTIVTQHEQKSFFSYSCQRIFWKGNKNEHFKV